MCPRDQQPEAHMLSRTNIYLFLDSRFHFYIINFYISLHVCVYGTQYVLTTARYFFLF